MPYPGLILTFLREIFGSGPLPREPLPHRVMDQTDAVSAYTDPDRKGAFDALALFHTARISQVIQGCSTVLDLGCGPARQLAHVAELNPQVSFTGIDLSELMCASGRAHLKQLGIDNVRLMSGDMTRLDGIEDHSMDGVISTVALHTLPSREDLEATFKQISRVLKPDGALYLIDFGRLKSLKSVIFFSYRDTGAQQSLISLDYERSMRAAFTEQDFIDLAKRFLPAHVQCLSTFKMPFFVLIKSADRPLPHAVHEILQKKRAALPHRWLSDLDDLRFFFRFGGLKNDPFEGPLESPGERARERMAYYVDQPRFSKTVGMRGIRLIRLGRGILKIIQIHLTDRVKRAWIHWRYADSIAAQARIALWQKDLMNQTGAVLYTTLGTLKGPLMKIGQIASYMEDRLPEPIRRALIPLQDTSRPVASHLIRQRVEAELGKPIDQLFSVWYDQPIAAASISQLHLARLPDGQDVVVKVKYPGMEKMVHADLRILNLAAPLLARTMHLNNMQKVLGELGRMFLAECDFLDEARSQEMYRRVYAGDAEVIIPRVVSGYITRNVLTMEYVDAMNFSDFAATATPEQKTRAATTIGRTAAISIYRHRMLNADPHPGNYLFMPDGRVCLLDFGFVKRWSPETIDAVRAFGLSAYHNDLPRFRDAAWRLGYRKQGNDLDYVAFLHFLRSNMFLPWLEDRPFQFTREFACDQVKNFAKFLKYNGPIIFPEEMLTFSRVFFGYHMIFGYLGAEMNWHRILYPLLTA